MRKAEQITAEGISPLWAVLGETGTARHLLTQNQSIMKKNKVEEYLQSEDGKRNAERFLKAVREHRILCNVKRVSSSGMSRIIGVYEIRNDENGRPHILQFNWFLGQIGFTYNDNYNAIRVGGCGMDMVFHLLYTAVDRLRYYGLDVEPRLEFTTCDYMYV